MLTEATKLWITEILNDQLSGSTQLLDKILDGLRLLEPDKEAQVKIKERLVKLDPSMQILRHFLAEWLPATWPETRLFIQEYMNYWSGVPDRLARSIGDHYSTGVQLTVVTHSRSGTVQQVLGKLKRRQYIIDVIQTRSIPGEEGRIQCDELRQLGINTRLIQDDLTDYNLTGAEICFLGCDKHNENGFINKVGTVKIIDKILPQQVWVLTDGRKKLAQIEPPGSELFEYVPFREGIRFLEA